MARRSEGVMVWLVESQPSPEMQATHPEFTTTNERVREAHRSKLATCTPNLGETKMPETFGHLLYTA